MSMYLVPHSTVLYCTSFCRFDWPISQTFNFVRRASPTACTSPTISTTESIGNAVACHDPYYSARRDDPVARMNVRVGCLVDACLIVSKLTLHMCSSYGCVVRTPFSSSVSDIVTVLQVRRSLTYPAGAGRRAFLPRVLQPASNWLMR